MANQPRPGSRKYTIQLDKEVVEALERAKIGHESESDSHFLAEIVKKGVQVPEPNGKVPEPKFDPDKIQNYLEKHWQEGAKVILTRLMKAHKAEILTWERDQRLIGGW